jgi:hypothetical protein
MKYFFGKIHSFFFALHTKKRGIQKKNVCHHDIFKHERKKCIFEQH